MSAFVRTQPDATWLAGYTPGTSDFEDWDRKVAAMMNGDDGGCWAPSTPIVFSSAGAGEGQLVISGPAKVCYGGRLTTLSGARFLLPTGQFEQLAAGHAGRTRALTACFLDATVEPPAAGFPVPPGGVQVFGTRWRIDLAPEPALPSDNTIVGPFEERATRSLIEFDVHDGATLATVTLSYIARLGTPRARLVRYDANGNPTPITLTAAGADADGWTQLPAADPRLDVQVVTIACDVGVVADRSANSYWLQLEEDQNLKDKVYLLKRPARVVATTNLEILHDTPVIDGVQTVAGDVVLLTGQTDLKENGLWHVVGVGNTFYQVGFTHVTGSFVLSTSDGVYPSGYVVPVAEGAMFAGTLWQMTGKTDVVGRLGSLGSPAYVTEQAFARFATAGNTYLSATAHLTNITDTRWQ